MGASLGVTTSCLVKAASELNVKNGGWAPGFVVLEEVTPLHPVCSLLRTRPLNKDYYEESLRGDSRKAALSRAPSRERGQGCPHPAKTLSGTRASRTGPEASPGEAVTPVLRGSPEDPKNTQHLPPQGRRSVPDLCRSVAGPEKPVQPRRDPRNLPVQAPHFVHPCGGGANPAPFPRPGRTAPCPWWPPHRPASRVLTATPGRARPQPTGRAARDAPRGRSGRPRGGGRAWRARSHTPRLAVPSRARSATLRTLAR